MRNAIRLYKEGRLKEALQFLDANSAQSLRTIAVTYVHLLKHCSNVRVLSQGHQIHAHLARRKLESNAFVASSLVSMYAKCGSLTEARNVFNTMPKRDTIAWNAMITAYVQLDNGDEALKLYQEMKQRRMKPDRVTFACLLDACSNPSAIEQGRQIHADAIEAGMVADIYVSTALVDMYAKCGNILNAQKVFEAMPKRTVVSWNAMIAGYAKLGNSVSALEFWQQMKIEGVKPDRVTFLAVLNACANLAALEQGKQVHADIIQAGVELDTFVGTALIDMYAKCGSLALARQIFNWMPRVDVTVWNVMIAGYAKFGKGEEALNLCWRMKRDGIKPQNSTLVPILNACATLANLEQGKQVHALAVEIGSDSEILVGNALVDMYVKCGNLEVGRHVFDRMPERDVISWNAIMGGYSSHGHDLEAFMLFKKMETENVAPDAVTFVSILSVCSHLGLVNEARMLFDSMSEKYGLNPSLEHYGCMIDLLGRAGYLDEAHGLIKRMPFPPSVDQWMALLGACRNYGKFQLAEQITELILQLEPQGSAAYVLLSNVYATAERWGARAELREEMKIRGVNKNPGCCWVDANNKTNALVSADRLQAAHL